MEEKKKGFFARLKERQETASFLELILFSEDLQILMMISMKKSKKF